MSFNRKNGFTVVEIMVVVIVIAIIATISVVSYSNVQKRSRDAQRRQDIEIIVNALERYYEKYGAYPTITSSGSSSINQYWSTTRDSSWNTAGGDAGSSWRSLGAALVPEFLKKLPVDPGGGNQTGYPLGNGGGYAYSYFGGSYCGSGSGQMFIIVYRLESTTQEDVHSGECSTNPLTYSYASEYRVARH